MITLSRPDRLNALSLGMVSALSATLGTAAERELRVIVLTGTGRAFSAGFDLVQELSARELDTEVALLQGLPQAIRALPIPLIAAVNGLAVGGGCELALACDLIVAEPDAAFALPEIELGTVIGSGASFNLPRRIGFARASEMVLMGRHISAPEALAIGLINEIAPEGQACARALGIAAEIAGRPAAAVRAAKLAIRHGMESDLSRSVQFELKELNRLNHHPGTQQARAEFAGQKRRGAHSEGGTQ